MEQQLPSKHTPVEATLLDALKLARAEIAWWVGEHECCEGKEAEAMAKINAAIALAEGGGQ